MFILNLVKQLWPKVKNSKVFWAVIVALALFSGGYLLGRNHKVPAQIIEHTVVDQTTAQKLQEALKTQEDLKQQLTVAQQTISDLKTHQVVKEHIIHEKNGTTIEDKTTTTDTSKVVDKTTDTSKTTEKQVASSDSKTVDTKTTTHTDTTKIMTPMVKDKWFAGASMGLGLKGFTTPGVELKYRLIGPFWLGAAATTAPEFRLGAGVSF
jgi:hypothetical protein